MPLLFKAQLRLQEEVVARPAEDRGGDRREKEEASEFPRLLMEENREAEREGSCPKVTQPGSEAKRTQYARNRQP